MTHNASAFRAGGRFRRPALLGAGTVAALLASTLLAPVAGGATAPHAAAPRVFATAAAPLARATAVGKLTATGCTFSGAAAICDLYARAGTASILGTPLPIWGFSTASADDPTAPATLPTAPGPVLVVHQGDAVTITVHNQLAGQNVSLALPGQAAADLQNTSGDDVTGAATDGVKGYSFTANRPGTFLYEAGHTPNGARQVAMGLAGALVVLPTDNTAYGNAYDDEAVLVMTEIDPQLNADPTNFDMRKFAPKYRTFNGKPYPAADPVATDQGHRVLLRYVNAGSQTHAIGVLGGDQQEIAQDGHPMAYPMTVTAESIDPGATLDTLVTMPTGPEAKLALYEPAMHLDNNGQHTGDQLQFAFGGMLTFLDTNAPPPSSDGIGPVSSHITVSPNPSDGLAPVTVTADLSDATTGGSAVSQAEFVIDDAFNTAVGFGTPMSATFGAVGVTGATGTISTAMLAALDAGKHSVFVRALDANGNWGVIGSAILSLPKTGPQTTNGSVDPSPANGGADVAISATGDDSAAGGTITAAEYFLDTAGANGTGTALTRNRTATVVSEDGAVPAATVKGLGEGKHHILVHSKDSLGLWGPTLDLPLVVDLTGPAVDAAAVGPNPTNGILTDSSNPGYLVVSGQITDKDAGGAAQSIITDAEAFLDPTTANPGGGTGLQLIAVDGKLDSTTEAVYGLIPISQIFPLADGTHHVSVRGQDAAGNWGPLYTASLQIDKAAPVLTAPLVATPNPTNGAANLTLTAAFTEANGLGGAEVWIGTADPGAGNGIAASVGIAGGKAVVLFPLAGVLSGRQQFNLRVQDKAGNWSNGLNTMVTVSRPNAIFANNFEPTDAAWSAATGALSATTGAAMKTAAEPASTRGLQVALPGGRNNRASYLTDRSPVVETSYHARFVFNPNTLKPGTGNVLTLFEGRTAQNRAVFTVAYRINNRQQQVRTVMVRNGFGTVTGTWVNLPAGNVTVQLDWSAAATVRAQGSLKLQLNGKVVSTQTTTNSTLRLESALLGMTAGFSTRANGTTVGTAYFDSFSSTRFTLP